MPLTLPDNTTHLYVPCNESAGTTLDDLAYPAHPLTILAGTTSFTTAGPGGNRNAFVVQPYSTIYNQTPLDAPTLALLLETRFSVMLWINPSALPDPAGDPAYLLTVEANTIETGAFPFILELLPSGQLQVTLSGFGAGTNTTILTSAATVTPDVWSSVGFDYDRVNSQARFTINTAVEAWQPTQPNTFNGPAGATGIFVLAGLTGGDSAYAGGLALVLVGAQIWYEEAHIQFAGPDITAPAPNGGSMSVTLTSVYPNLTYTLKAAGVTGSLELLRWTISTNALTSTYLPDSLLSILSARLASIVATIAPGDVGAMHAILLPLLSTWDLAGNGLVLSAGSGAGYVTLNLGTFDSTTAYVALSVPHSTAPSAT